MTTTTGFVSSLAPHFEAYLVLMRAVGRRYNRVESILRQLDQFVAKEPPGDVRLVARFRGSPKMAAVSRFSVTAPCRACWTGAEADGL